MLLEAFIKEARFNKKQVSALTHLYNVYLELKEQREKELLKTPIIFWNTLRENLQQVLPIV